MFGSGEQVSVARRLLRKSDTIYPKEYMKHFENGIDFDEEDEEAEREQDLLNEVSQELKSKEDNYLDENNNENLIENNQTSDDNDDSSDDKKEKSDDNKSIYKLETSVSSCSSVTIFLFVERLNYLIFKLKFIRIKIILKFKKCLCLIK